MTGYHQDFQNRGKCPDVKGPGLSAVLGVLWHVITPRGEGVCWFCFLWVVGWQVSMR